MNFYDGYGLFDAVKARRPKYAKPLYANLLRSEHIPYNIFIPFKTEKALFAAVMSDAFGIPNISDFCIKIEHSPKLATDHLCDNTPFDVFCDCTDAERNHFFLGIEVKYTEQGQPPYERCCGAQEKRSASEILVMRFGASFGDRHGM